MMELIMKSKKRLNNLSLIIIYLVLVIINYSLQLHTNNLYIDIICWINLFFTNNIIISLLNDWSF